MSGRAQIVVASFLFYICFHIVKSEKEIDGARREVNFRNGAMCHDCARKRTHTAIIMIDETKRLEYNGYVMWTNGTFCNITLYSMCER